MIHTLYFFRLCLVTSSSLKLPYIKSHWFAKGVITLMGYPYAVDTYWLFTCWQILIFFSPSANYTIKSFRSIYHCIYIEAHSNMTLKGYEVIVLRAHVSSNTGMHVYLDRWLQHLQSGDSYEHQVGCCDSPQVWSQSQYSSLHPIQWIQFPAQRKHEPGQLPLYI